VLACALILAAACGGGRSVAAHRSPAAPPIASPSPQAPWPAPAAQPNYPPRDLADLSALAAAGEQRQPAFTESQPLDVCAMGWTMIVEPAAVSPRQEAADLMRMAVQKQFLFATCGGNLFGSTNGSYCNCYRGDRGVLYIERGPARAPSPGMMQVVFWVRDGADSPGDWRLVVPAPAPS